MGWMPKSDKMYEPQARRYNKLPVTAECCMASVFRRKSSMGNVLNWGGNNVLQAERKE